ncbi:MAG: N-acetylmuramoyl-L-alanine amidase-like domain-containing protein [Fidelibacterota bacterium]|nr:DUF1460 domain-containing protein [Candidatus Neomarinimicrobiota bacterium]
MKSSLLLKFIFYFLFFTNSCTEIKWIDTLPKPWTLSEDALTKILPKFHEEYPDFHDRLLAFSLWQVGKPYELFCLGEEEGRDLDPIFRLDVSDCTVHILTSLASIQSQSWSDAKSKLIKIHYKPNSIGKSTPTYNSRWHYTSDRIENNPSTKNITNSLVLPDKLKSVSLTLNQKSNGKEFLELDWKKSIIINYIPSDNITSEIFEKLPVISGVAFVKESYFDTGLIVAHEGMIINNKNIIHASSEYKKTVNMDFMEYYFRSDGPLFDGVLFYSFHPINK